MIDATHYVALSLIMMCIGLVGVMVRRNFITVLMSLELMFNAVNLNLIAFPFDSEISPARCWRSSSSRSPPPKRRLVSG